VFLQFLHCLFISFCRKKLSQFPRFVEFLSEPVDTSNQVGQQRDTAANPLSGLG
jgi:hypothetical protein